VDGWTYVRMDVPTDGQTFPPLMLLGRLRGAVLKKVPGHMSNTSTEAAGIW